MLEQNGPITKSYLIKSHYGITYIYSQDGHKYVYNWVNKDDDNAAFKWPLREFVNKRWCLWKVSIYIIDLGTDFKSVIGTTYWCSMVNLCHHLSCLFVCLFLVGFWFFGKGGGAFSNLNHQYADYQRKMFAEVQYSNNVQ